MRTLTQGLPWLARLEDLTPIAKNFVSVPKLPKQKEGEVPTAILFSGYLEAPADDQYTFALPAGSTWARADANGA